MAVEGGVALTARDLVEAAALAILLTALAHTPAAAQEKRITARQVIARIQQHVGVEWREPTVDTFKAGDPDTPVTGIATVMMSTLEVLKRAVAAGDNLIITHEPTFYDHNDQTLELEGENDAVLAVKQAFIKQHGLVIWRFHDYWHRRRPDGIQTGMIHKLGWDNYRNGGSDQFFVLPQTTLAGLASEIKRRLGIRALRVVGDPKMPVTKVGLSAGFPGFTAQRHLLQSDKVQALVMGEAHEWETIEYAADAAAAKKGKALIVLGHIPSEEGGMEECARWLKTFVTEVPVQFISTPEPFWLPK
jgi:putative NIF3 family GTP cyclohydrolase 1 type 2